MNDLRLRVLLVEDHDAYAQTLATLLDADGRLEVVDRAVDGNAGIDLALRHVPDAILMDIHMPNLDGIEATRELGTLLPETPVVILSSSDLPDELRRAREAGAVACLLKDAAVGEIVAAVERAAARSTAADECASRAVQQQPHARLRLRLCL